ncbi:MAG: type II secretion system protein [Candidatus Gracilibacteria bacterium]
MGTGFTLVELLIVLTIVAILAVATVLILNPAEILKKSRDTQRMSDVGSMKSAIGLYLSTATAPILGGVLDDGCADDGTAAERNIWLSYPSDTELVTDATPPATWGDAGANAWTQVTKANAGLISGAGWIPVNLTGTSGGASISNWPLDPNSNVAAVGAVTNADRMYRYACYSSAYATAPSTFEIDANLESSYYAGSGVATNAETSDGGDNANLYEVGTNLTILPGTDTF